MQRQTLKKKTTTTNDSSINQIRVSQKSNLYISFSFTLGNRVDLQALESVKEQRTLQIMHPWRPLSGPFFLYNIRDFVRWHMCLGKCMIDIKNL